MRLRVTVLPAARIIVNCEVRPVITIAYNRPPYAASNALFCGDRRNVPTTVPACGRACVAEGAFAVPPHAAAAGIAAAARATAAPRARRVIGSPPSNLRRRRQIEAVVSVRDPSADVLVDVDGVVAASRLGELPEMGRRASVARAAAARRRPPRRRVPNRVAAPLG